MREAWIRIGSLRPVLMALICVGVLAGCHPDMWNQPRYTAYQPSDFFKDGASSRPYVDGVVPYDGARRDWADPIFAELTGEPVVPSMTDEYFYTGKIDGQEAADNYFSITPELLERGRERYNITCIACHGMLGNGGGVIPSRGFPTPSTYHQDRLREVGDGYFFDVITNGFGRMYSYASRIKPEDRWAITAYVRALQTSQNIDITDSDEFNVLKGIEEQERRAAEEAAAAAAHGHGGHGGGHHDDGDHEESHGDEHSNPDAGHEGAAAHHRLELEL